MDNKEKSPPPNFISTVELYRRYVAASGNLSQSTFGKYVLQLFNNVKVVRRKFPGDSRQINYYYGLYMNATHHKTITDAISSLKKICDIILTTSDLENGTLHFMQPKQQDGHVIYIDVHIDNHGRNLLCMLDKINIDLSELQFPSKITFDYCGISAIAHLVKSMNICAGKTFNKSTCAVVSTMVISIGVDGGQIVRSKNCVRVVNMTTTSSCCSKCQDQTKYSKRIKVI